MFLMSYVSIFILKILLKYHKKGFRESLGNMKTETNAKGKTKTYTYDIANRKTSTSYDDATLNESYEYDNGANAKGKLTKITDASGSMEFTYDSNGNLASKT